MSATQTNECAELLERVVEFAQREADILGRLARWRPPRPEASRRRAFHADLVTIDHLVSWSTQIAQALIVLNGIRGGAGTASKLWSRVRALVMSYRPDWTVDELVVYQLTKDQYGGFPFGLSVADIARAADGRFTPARIRSAVTRLARRGLAMRCFSKRAVVRSGNPIPTREHVWFYAGPGSKYAETPERVYYMHTPWAERPRSADAG